MESSLNLPPLPIAALLREYGLFAKKGLGQNFLTDPAALEKIVEAANISKNDSVLEIGPGLGSLTRYLAQSARRVIAVELDASLLPVLQNVLTPWKNVTLIQGDILDLNPADIMPDPDYLVVANIPYYITSAVIRHLLEANNKPSRLVLTVQQEVAQRICSGPGKASLLSLSVQVYGQPRPIVRIPAGAFYPSPKIDSTALRIDLYPEPLIASSQINLFFQLAKAGFSQKRKTLRNAISSGMQCSPDQAVSWLLAAKIDPQRRAETLTIDEWQILTSIVGS